MADNSGRSHEDQRRTDRLPVILVGGGAILLSRRSAKRFDRPAARAFLRG